jgi:hypothetical protein
MVTVVDNSVIYSREISVFLGPFEEPAHLKNLIETWNEFNSQLTVVTPTHTHKRSRLTFQLNVAV